MDDAPRTRLSELTLRLLALYQGYGARSTEGARDLLMSSLFDTQPGGHTG